METKPINDAMRLTIESAFYQNNVETLASISDAYLMALHADDTIVTDLDVYQAETLGLPQGAKVLVNNHGSIVGRTARARQILGDASDEGIIELIQDVIAKNSFCDFVRANASVGLHESFTMNASLMIPKKYVNNAYNFLLNFNPVRVANPLEELFLYVDPDWSSEKYPDGLVVLDPISHTGIVLGLKYFGEIKKGILSLAWNIAHRRGYISCHGGLKVLNGTAIAAFGLSGSGKSTLTLHDHKDEDTVAVLHDDAFVISSDFNRAIALEPSYFDKTSDMKEGSDAIKYLTTVQNNGVTLDSSGKRILVTEDRRNKNGRCIKSYFATPNRVNHVDQPLDALLWIMKDASLPPLVKVNSATLASSMGATLMTTRSNAENASDEGQVVIEPYANPFRIYPLCEDYEKFKALFDTGETACYIVNTGYFDGKKVTPQVSLSLLEGIANKTLEFKSLSTDGCLEYAVVEGYEPNLEDEHYLEAIEKSFAKRVDYVETLPEDNDLPDEVRESFAINFR